MGKDKGKVQFSYGARQQEFSAGGKRMGDIKGQLEVFFGAIGGQSAVVNGKSVDDDYVLQDGDKVAFFKPSGAKGR